MGWTELINNDPAQCYESQRHHALSGQIRDTFSGHLSTNLKVNQDFPAGFGGGTTLGKAVREPEVVREESSPLCLGQDVWGEMRLEKGSVDQSEPRPWVLQQKANISIVWKSAQWSS